MSPNHYITKNYEQIKYWLSGVTKHGNQALAEDLVQEVILIFLSHPKAQESIDTGTSRFFLVRIALNQWRSNTSPFAKQYQDSYLDYDDKVLFDIEDNAEYDIEIDAATEAVLDALDALYQGTSTDRYDAIMILMYYSMGCNYSAVGRNLNITHSTVRKVVLRGINKLKKKINYDAFRTNNDFSCSWNTDSSSAEFQAISLATQILKLRYFNPA